MPSITTLSRALVLVVIGAIIFKGWHLYGPSAEQVKAAAVSAAETAEATWKNWQPKGDETPPEPKAQGAAPVFAGGAQLTTEQSAAPIAPPLTPTNPTTAMAQTPVGTATPKLEPVAPASETAPQVSSANEERLPALLSRLEKLGAADPKLAAWGSSGNLYRFCCRAAMNDSPAFTQHFESVAGEPELAVEQVLAKVEAWRTARLASTTLR